MGKICKYSYFLDQQKYVIHLATEALEKYSFETEKKFIAISIKKELDIKYDHGWSCIIGKSYI